MPDRHEYEPSLPKIKEWANLHGSESYLGQGSYGCAWKVGNQVIKITTDELEVNVAALLKVHKHPNIYDVHKVALMKSLSEITEHNTYVIVYDYLEKPSNVMVNIVSKLSQYNWSTLPTACADMKSFDIEEIVVDCCKRILATTENEDKDNQSWSFNQFLQAIWNLGFDGMFAYYLIFLVVGWQDREKSATPYGWLKTVQSWLPSCNEKLQVAADLVAAELFLLKELGVLARDVHDENICQKDGRLVLIDLGISKSNLKGDVEILERQSVRRYRS